MDPRVARPLNREIRAVAPKEVHTAKRFRLDLHVSCKEGTINIDNVLYYTLLFNHSPNQQHAFFHARQVHRSSRVARYSEDAQNTAGLDWPRDRCTTRRGPRGRPVARGRCEGLESLADVKNERTSMASMYITMTVS